MKESPILFSAPMVLAILAGRKTQTRRIVKPQPDASLGDAPGAAWNAGFVDVKCPYGDRGDRLWVRHRADIFPVYYKPIVGWEGLYAAGTDGRIYRMDRGEPEPLAGSPSSKGYLTVSLSRGTWETHAIHKLICEAFYGPPPFAGAQVRHVDGDQTNNAPANLDWGSHEQNWQDRKAHGRGMGAEHHAAKLTPDQVAEIRGSKEPQRALAERFGVSQSTIWEARNGRTWGEHAPAPRNLPAFRLWRPSIHMPRWASRLLLEVTDVRVQRLQEITEEDSRAEGVSPFFELYPEIGRDQSLLPGELCADAEHRASFAVLWDEINGDRALFSSNPWVWAISFRRLEETRG